ncbi:MAG: pyruvate kinase [Chloroflexota bacterium]
MLRVKIVCTIGPASRKPEVLTQMIESGMNVARLNMSHGSHEYHAESAELIRSLAAKMGKSVAILMDLQGPKLRMGKMQTGGVPLHTGEDFVLTNEDIVGVAGRAPVQYKTLPTLVKKGERILIDDGLLELEVTETSENEIHTKVVFGGMLHDNKGINLPDASLGIPAITDKDRTDVLFALEQKADWIAFSFVRTSSEVIELKDIIKENSPNGYATPVISKIEKPDAVHNIDAIIQASDAIMVARGDLGIETSPEAVPITQKLIINKCLKAAKPVITATQMLDSMIRNPRPTRAEASDVANAVLDGTDAIMLSGETAVGTFPVEAVKTMANIAGEAESAIQNVLPTQFDEPDIFSNAGAVCHATIQAARETKVKAILAPTMSGNTPKLIAAFRPNVPVLAITPVQAVQHRLCLHWGTYPLITKELNHTDEVIDDALQKAKESEQVNSGDSVVVTAGVVGGQRTATNLMLISTIE